MANKRNEYIPALKYDWLTPLYDPLLRWVLRESIFKRQLVKQAQIQSGHRVLDLGCGTATLTLLIKEIHPGSETVGLDGDLRVLKIARAKAAKSGMAVTLHQGMAFELPYPDGAFDRVVSSLVLHHLTRDAKARALREVFRVLRPDGELHVVDFGKPQTVPMYLVSLIVRWLEEASDNVKGLLPELFRNAGFDPVEETAQYMTPFGILSLYKARKPLS